MSLFQAAVLGIVQGLTEFLPISSTAHLVLFPWFFGWSDPGLVFDVALHLGTLIALIAVFAREMVRMARAVVRSLFAIARLRPNHMARLRLDVPAALVEPDVRLGWAILLGTVPAGGAGLLFESQVETVLRNPLVIAGAMILFGLLLGWSDRVGPKRLPISAVTIARGVGVGFAQALALIPGVSRSGVTITAGLLLGLEREAAARFAFLLSAPIIAAGGSLSTMRLAAIGFPPGMESPFLVGFVAAAVSGFLCIKYLLRFLQRHSVAPFVWYRLVLGGGILAWVVFKDAGPS